MCSSNESLGDNAHLSAWAVRRCTFTEYNTGQLGNCCRIISVVQNAATVSCTHCTKMYLLYLQVCDAFPICSVSLLLIIIALWRCNCCQAVTTKSSYWSLLNNNIFRHNILKISSDYRGGRGRRSTMSNLSELSFSTIHFWVFSFQNSRTSAIILNELIQVKMQAGVAPIGLFWKHWGRGACTRAHTHIWLISSKLKHFVRGVHSRYTHARTRRLNLILERDTYSELGYISPFNIYSLSNYILVSSKKWRRAASRQLPGNLHGCTGPPLKIEGMVGF